jgi:hypothetical protein
MPWPGQARRRESLLVARHGGPVSIPRTALRVRGVTMLLPLSQRFGGRGGNGVVAAVAIDRTEKKAAPEGEFRSRLTSAELLDRVRGLGDKPVRMNLTHTIWGAD